ncbi:MAG: nucleotidyl transferase AbiEii/AbiGii toxin family protein, partial [Pseudomonadota bacterium]
MLTQPQLQRFAHESGIKNLEIVEKEVVLTYFLQLLSERGFLVDVAFKGGTCIRKTWLGPNGRFSTDVDFTAMRQCSASTILTG